MMSSFFLIHSKYFYTPWPVTIYERNINSTVRKISDHELIVSTSLLDLNHSMRVELKIDLKHNLIKEADAEITKAPLQICSYPLQKVKNLVGLKVERGINKRLASLVGGSQGCTHLYELALNAVRLAFNVKLGMQFDWDQWTSRTIPDEEFLKKAQPVLQGSYSPFDSHISQTDCKKDPQSNDPGGTANQ